jgi:hypothetical protein
MLRRYSQNLPHVTALGAGRSDAVGPIRKCDKSIDAKVYDNFRLSGKTMNMSRLMVLRIGYKQSISETPRRHDSQSNPSRFGYQTPRQPGLP